MSIINPFQRDPRTANRGLRNSTSGFTLIELVVVMALISLFLFFSIPRIQTVSFSDSTRTASQWIMASVRSLKERSMREKKIYVLNVDIDSGSFWAAHESMTETELETAKRDAFTLPRDMKIIDIAYPDTAKVSAGETAIFFTGKGYSDKALIHIENDRQEIRSFLIEPFLWTVKIYENYKEF